MNNIFENITFIEQKKLLKLLEMNISFYKEKEKVPSIINNDLIAVIIGGSVEISKTDYNGNKIIVDELYENGMFGKMFLHNFDETTIISKEVTEVLYIDYENVLNFENSNYKYYNQFIKNLLKLTNHSIKEKNERIEILTKKTIRDKLLEYLYIEAKKHGSKNIYLPFSFTDLAYFLATDRSALSREFNNLKKEGFITSSGRKITIINY